MDKLPNGKQPHIIPYERMSTIHRFLGKKRGSAPEDFLQESRKDISKWRKNIECAIENAAAGRVFAACLAQGRRDRAHHGQPIANKELRDKLNQLHRSAAALSQALAMPDPRLPLATRRHRAALFRRMRATTADMPIIGIVKIRTIAANNGAWEQDLRRHAHAIAYALLADPTLQFKLNEAADRLNVALSTPAQSVLMDLIECAGTIERLTRNARDHVRLTKRRMRHRGKTASRDFARAVLGVWFMAVHRWPKPEEFKELLRLVTEPLAQHIPGIEGMALTPTSYGRMLAAWRPKDHKRPSVQ